MLQAQTQPAGTAPPNQEDLQPGRTHLPHSRGGPYDQGRELPARRNSHPLDFRGTVLLPDADGSAMVKANKGSTEIRAKFK